MNISIYRFSPWFVFVVSLGMLLPATGAGAGQPGMSDIVGTYAMRGIGRGGLAPGGFVGVARFGRDGDFVASIKEFQPADTFGDRLVVEKELVGTFEVEGQPLMGGRTGTITLLDSEEQLPFVVTKVNEHDASAQEISLIREFVNSVTGNLTSITLIRRDTVGLFDNRSFNGTYTFSLIGEGGVAPTAGVGIIQYDGEGNGCSRGTLNLPGATFGERIFFDFGPFPVRYKVNRDGTGVVCFPDPTGSGSESSSQQKDEGDFCAPGEIENVFVITKTTAVEIDGENVNLNLEHRWSNRQLDPFTGVFVSGIDNRISDDVDLASCMMP